MQKLKEDIQIKEMFKKKKKFCYSVGNLNMWSSWTTLCKHGSTHYISL